MEQKDWGALCAYHRRSHYDLIQAHNGVVFGPVWTFPHCDPLAAAQTATMLRRMGERRVRHTRRARLNIGAVGVDVVVVTEFPALHQVVLRLSDGRPIGKVPFLRDASLAALEASFLA